MKTVYTAGATLPEVAESVSPSIAFLARFLSELFPLIGFPDRIKSVGSPKHEWLQEKLDADKATVNGAVLVGGTTITLQAGQSTRFAVGDVIQVDGSRELIRVTALPGDPDLTVVRGQYGTIAVAIADGATIKIISNPALDCEDAPDAVANNRDRRVNYTQIFRKTASVCRTMRKSTILGGIEDELEHQVMLKERELLREYAKALINGRQLAANPEGTATTERTMDGIIQMIIKGTDSVVEDALGAPLDETILNSALQELYNRGAMVQTLLCGGKQRAALTALMQDRVRYTADDGILGMKVQQFNSDFGLLNIANADIFVPSDCVILLDINKIRPVKLGNDPMPWERTPIAKQGLSDIVEIVGELGLEMENADDGGHALIQNLAFV